MSSTKEMNPITRKSMSKLVLQPSFRAVGQTHAKWQTCRSTHAWLLYWFVSYFWVFQMSTIPRVFGQQLWNLAASLILTCSFSWWGSFLWLMTFNYFMLITVACVHINFAWVVTHLWSIFTQNTVLIRLKLYSFGFEPSRFLGDETFHGSSWFVKALDSTPN